MRVHDRLFDNINLTNIINKCEEYNKSVLIVNDNSCVVYHSTQVLNDINSNVIAYSRWITLIIKYRRICKS